MGDSLSKFGKPPDTPRVGTAIEGRLARAHKQRPVKSAYHCRQAGQAAVRSLSFSLSTETSAPRGLSFYKFTPKDSFDCYSTAGSIIKIREGCNPLALAPPSPRRRRRAPRNKDHLHLQSRARKNNRRSPPFLLLRSSRNRLGTRACCAGGVTLGVMAATLRCPCGGRLCTCTATAHASRRWSLRIPMGA